MNPSASGRTILLIDDDRVFGNLVVSQLSKLGFRTDSARSWTEAQAHLDLNEPDIILLDVRLPDVDGMDLLGELLLIAPVLVLTAFGSIRAAVNAIKAGAADYLVKPVDLDELELVIRRILGHAELQKEMTFVRSRSQAQARRQSFMVGSSPELAKVDTLIGAVAAEEVTVLITGESGVGKELVAREIHQRSSRCERSFLTLDCCTLQENLFESELFGHEKGAFTGATQQKSGLIEGAKGGTLFLDEIGEIDPVIQAKLLRVIETGEFRRLGGNRKLQSDARILAATNRDLEALARSGAFRSDLYYRLSAFTITVPPLRERRSDIIALVAHFLANHNFSRRINKELSQAAARALDAYDWPGNVRELRNVIERAVIVSGDEKLIQPAHLGFDTAAPPPPGSVSFCFDHEPTVEELRNDYLAMLHDKYQGQRGRLARIMGISERNLYRLLKKQGLV